MSQLSYVAKEIKKDRLESEYEITIDSQQFNDRVKQKLEEIAKVAKVDGFRKGKVPFNFIKNNYSGDATSQVVNDIIDESTKRFFEENNLTNNVIHKKVEVLSLPKLSEEEDNSNVQDNGFVYKLLLESMPEIPTLDIENLHLKTRELTVEQEDIDEFINTLKSTKPNFIEAESDHQIAKNDKVSIDCNGKIKNKIFKEGNGKDLWIIIGKHQLLEDFENNLLGMKKGEQKTFSLKFPDNYHVKHLASKEAVFWVKINSIFIPTEYANDEEFIKTTSSYKNLDDFYKNIKQYILNQYEEMNNSLYMKEIFDFIDSNYDFDLPKFLVAKEQEKIIAESNKDSSIDIEKESKKRVKLGMMLIKYSDANNIKINQKELLDFIYRMYISKGVPPSEIDSAIRANSDFINFIKGKILEDKIVKHIVEKAKKDIVVMSIREFKELSKQEFNIN